MSAATSETATATRLCPRCGAHGSTADCAACGTPTIAIPGGGDDPESLVGTVIGGKYAVQGVLGHGGMGTVYQGEQALVERPVAIKVMRSEVAADSDAVKRFQREAKLTSKLSHPNTIRLFDFGLTDDGLMYLVMEMLSGRELADEIQQRGSLELPQALDVAVQVAQALGAAHELGIVHRDLKPGNVFLVPQSDGSDLVKVMDFGIAKSIDDAEATQVTQAGMLVGTPAYMSPEQAKGAQLTANSDIYALGIILYEMLTGAVPFHAESMVSVLMMHVGRQPPPVRERRPDLANHAALQGALDEMLAKAPDKRPDAAGAVTLLRSVAAAPSQAPAVVVTAGAAATVHVDAGGDVDEATAFVTAMPDDLLPAAVRVDAGADVDEATAFVEAMPEQGALVAATAMPPDSAAVHVEGGVDVDEATAFVESMPDPTRPDAVKVDLGGDEDEATAFVAAVSDSPTRREAPRPARPVHGRRAPRGANARPTPAPPATAASTAADLGEATVRTPAISDPQQATVTAMPAAVAAPQPASKGGLPPAVFAIAAVGGVLTLGAVIVGWFLFGSGSDPSPEAVATTVAAPESPAVDPKEPADQPSAEGAAVANDKAVAPDKVPAPAKAPVDKAAAPEPTPAAPPNVEEPTSVKAAPAADRHKVRLTSTPPGATVSLEGLQVGHTPIDLDRPGKGTGVDVEFTLKGYKTQRVRLGHSHKGDLAVTLHKVAPKPKRRKRKRVRKKKRDDSGLDMMME